MMDRNVALLFTIALCIVAAVAEFQRLEERDFIVPRGWTLQHRSDANKPIKLQVAIKQQNVDHLTAILNEVSNPTHKNYGKYLTTEQIGNIVAPPQDRLERIYQWLQTAGVSSSQAEISLHKDFLTISLTIQQAEQLLQTQYFDYQYAKTRAVLSRTSKYHVPSDLANDIDFIGGTIRFPPSKDHGITSMIDRQNGGRQETLPPGDAPLIAYTQIGDKEVVVNFAPRCSNGQTLSSGTLACPGGTVLSGAYVSWWNGEREEMRSLAVVAGGPREHTARCASSAGWGVGTLHTAQQNLLHQFSLPVGTLFCSIRLEGLKNFETIDDAKLVVIDHSRSFRSNTTAIRALTPMPFVTPRRLQELYRIPTQLKNNQASNAQSVTEFLDQYYAPADLTTFMEYMGLDDYVVDKLIGPNIPSNPGLEASLDIQYMLGISNNVTTWFWSLGQLHEGQESFLQWLIDLSNTANPPYVHSTSYADEEQSLTLDYMTRVNTELVKAGVRGLTLLFSSGDDGVGGYSMRTNTSICEQRGFAPEFPSSSPWVTAVGGTQFSDRYLPICHHPIGHLEYKCPGEGEIVSSTSTGAIITSGGGFSINWPRPEYQDTAVYNYLSYLDGHNLNPPQWQWNRKGRGFPDISGMAHNYITIIGGDIIPVDGTSASTPVTAAMITLINDRLISLGKPRIGFFNPLLYQLGQLHPEVFTDIVVGENSCSASRGICCTKGFTSSPGWDATTGWGSLVFDILYHVITGTPPI